MEEKKLIFKEKKGSFEEVFLGGEKHFQFFFPCT